MKTEFFNTKLAYIVCIFIGLSLFALTLLGKYEFFLLLFGTSCTVGGSLMLHSEIKRERRFKTETAKFRIELRKAKTYKDFVNLQLKVWEPFGIKVQKIAPWHEEINKKAKERKLEDANLIDSIYALVYFCWNYECVNNFANKAEAASIDEMIPVFSEKFPLSKAALEAKIELRPYCEYKLNSLSDASLVNEAIESNHSGFFSEEFRKRFKRDLEEGRSMFLQVLLAAWNTMYKSEGKVRSFDEVLLFALKGLEPKPPFQDTFNEIKKMLNKNTKTGAWLRNILPGLLGGK